MEHYSVLFYSYVDRIERILLFTVFQSSFSVSVIFTKAACMGEGQVLEMPRHATQMTKKEKHQFISSLKISF